MTRIAAFRRTVNTRVAGFQYFFVADSNHLSVKGLSDPNAFFDVCIRFGAFFADKYVAPLPDQAYALNEILGICDLIYAPSLMASRGITGDRKSVV